eukprot:COSAG02_NODE_2628_length_8394_cov_3.247016_3_plen_69_part_00
MLIWHVCAWLVPSLATRVSPGTYKKERKEFARDSLAFARDPSIYDVAPQLGRGSNIQSDADGGRISAS